MIRQQPLSTVTERLTAAIEQASSPEWKVTRVTVPSLVAERLREEGQAVPGRLEFYGPEHDLRSCAVEEEQGRFGKAGVKFQFANPQGESWELVEARRKAAEAEAAKRKRKRSDGKPDSRRGCGDTDLALHDDPFADLA